MGTAFGVLAFVVVAALASLLRWRTGQALNSTVPWGTLAVNVTGAFLLGVAVARGWENLTLIGGAALGSFTTFSTLTAEVTTQWATPGQRRTAVLYLSSTIVLGVAAAAVGLQF